MNARLAASAAVLTLALASPSTMTFADKLDRTQRPPVGAAPTLTTPKVEKRTLSNGLPVWIVPRGSLPQATIVLQLRAGSADDEKPGIASMTASLLDDGTRKRSAREFVNAVDYLGASLTAAADEEQTVVSLTALTRHLDEGLALMGEMVSQPAFADEELERERKARSQALKQQRDQPTVVATQVFQRVVYGDQHPYGRPLLGTLASVEGISRDDIASFHDRFHRPGNGVLIAVGDVNEKDLIPRLEKAFAGWTSQPAPTQAQAAPGRPPGKPTGIYLVDKPGAAQSEIRIGHVGAARTTTPDYYALQVLNTLLGGQFTSRVNLNLRERHGFTYGARTSWSFRRGEGPFYAGAGVFTAKTDSSVTEFLAELKDLRGPRPATREETEMAKNALIRSYPRRLETNAGVASVLAELAFHGLTESEIGDYNRHVAEVTPEEITRVAAKYIAPESLAVVVVGDLAKIRPGLESLALGSVTVLDADGQEVTP
jgi:predicted Zn-dependent peptidase